MNNKRHILNDGDKLILDYIKNELTISIATLKERNVRHVNIQIELSNHIKESLNKL